MTWQDVVIAVGQFVFAVALIPSVRGRQKPALASSLITATGLTVFGVCFATLGLWLSMAGVWSSAAMWWVLAWQVRGARAVVSIEDAMREALDDAYWGFVWAETEYGQMGRERFAKGLGRFANEFRQWRLPDEAE